jgi:acyl carrier protein
MTSQTTTQLGIPVSAEIAMNQNGSTGSVSVESLKSWLCAWLAEELAMDAAAVDPGQTFLSYGLDSVQAMSMIGDLEVNFSRRLSPTLAWDYPTIDALAAHLAEEFRVENKPAAVVVPPQATSNGSRKEIESLLAGIEHIDEQEVDRLLAQYLGGSA